MTVVSPIKTPVWGVIFLCLCIGCGKYPSKNIDSALQALENAKNVKAKNLAAEEYSLAESSLRQAYMSLEKEKKRFIVFRNYSESALQFNETTTLAEAAADKAKTALERIRQEDEENARKTEAMKRKKTKSGGKKQAKQSE